jgi:hypothetical protein
MQAMINSLVDESERVFPTENASFNDTTMAFVLGCTLQRPVVFVREDNTIDAVLPLAIEYDVPFYFKENDGRHWLLAPKADAALPAIDRAVAFFKPTNRVTFENSVTVNFQRLNISLSSGFVISYKPKVEHV